ncbi:MAG TPA: hypothetical protein VL094_13175 [Sphingomonadaceae bacterium]|nr:hypothetical protein [Sphingomonadaceae bacterium]
MTEPASKSSNRLLLLIAALVVVIAAVWYLGPFGKEDEGRTELKADVTDVSGGELIVTEPTPGEVPVNVPDTPMTNVPPSASPSAQ